MAASKRVPRNATPPITHRGPTAFQIGSPQEHRYPVAQEIVDSVLADPGSASVRVGDLEILWKQIESPSSNTQMLQYELLYKAASEPCAARISTEEICYMNHGKRVLLFSVAITKVEKLKGSATSKAPHLLAACVGFSIATKIHEHLATLHEGYSLEVSLLLDVEKSPALLEIYWEFESAVEKYAKRINSNGNRKFAISSSI